MGVCVGQWLCEGFLYLSLFHLQKHFDFYRGRTCFPSGGQQSHAGRNL